MLIIFYQDTIALRIDDIFEFTKVYYLSLKFNILDPQSRVFYSCMIRRVNLQLNNQVKING